MLGKDRLYQHLADLIPDALCILQDNRLKFANASFVRLFGYDRKELDDAFDFYRLVRDEDRETVRQRYESRLAGVSVPTTLRSNLVRANGSTVPCETSATLIDFDRRPAALVIIRDVSEQTGVERALKHSETLHRRLFETMLEGAYQTRPDGTIITANPALVSMLGFDSVEELQTSAQAGDLYVSPEERKKFVSRLEKDGELRNVEFDLKRKDGTYITVLENARVVRDDSGGVAHYEGLLTDITERQQSGAALESAKEQLEATLDALPDILFRTDREGLLYEFRAPDPELLYLPPADFLGKKVTRILPENAARTVMKAIGEVVKSGKSKGAVYSLEMGGEERWFELSMAATGDLTKPEGRITALVRDITNRKRNEQKLEQTTRDLESDRKELSEKNIALNQILEHIEGQKRNYRLQVCRDIEDTIMPYVERLERKAEATSDRDIEDLKAALRMVLSKDIDEHQARYSRLTSRESEICEMIKAGMSSKEIAESLNLSVATILKHREHVREKLGITGRSMSLSTYLRTH